MEYRVNPRTGDQISILGIGSSGLATAGDKEAAATLRRAFENGINFFDLASENAACFPYYGTALSDVRDQVMYQIHFGADYTTGSYGRSYDLDTVRRSVDWQLTQMKTDYIDYGFIHCIDEDSDWETYLNNGVLDYIKTLKKEGIVRHIGMSSHVPAFLHKGLDTGLVDIAMFSINPAYDYRHGEYANGSTDERAELYRRCETEGVGISVMKIYSGGQLLDVKLSPFGKALTVYQCVQYALDKPGVLTVLPGIRGLEDLDNLLGFLTAPKEEKDYAIIGEFTPVDAMGSCVYCNHCQPCPAGLNVGLINKYYDLARAGDALAADHYRNLEKQADACTGCGRCNKRCPFQVDQSRRMSEIAAYFRQA